MLGWNGPDVVSGPDWTDRRSLSDIARNHGQTIYSPARAMSFHHATPYRRYRAKYPKIAVKLRGTDVATIDA